MSCYFRHMKNILVEAGIEVTPKNKTQIDQAIHSTVDVTYKDCSTTWKKIKQEIIADEKKRSVFIKNIKNALELDG